MAKNDFHYGGWNYYTLQCGIWLWNHDSEFTKWQHPAVQQCDTWLLDDMPLNSPGGSTLQYDIALGSWHWIHQVAAPCNVAGGSGMTCHGIHPNVHHIGILNLVLIWPYHRSQHVILHQSAKFYTNRTTLSRKHDVMSIFKMADLSHLEFYGSNNGFFEKPMYDFL